VGVPGRPPTLARARKEPCRDGSRTTSMSPEKRATTELVSSDRCSNRFKLGVCFGTDRTNSSQANDDNQSEHDGVLNGSWAIFFLQKVNDAISEILHVSFLAARLTRGLPPTHVGGITPAADRTPIRSFSKGKLCQICNQSKRLVIETLTMRIIVRLQRLFHLSGILDRSRSVFMGRPRTSGSHWLPD
jgi:hypothetical protein